MLAGCLCLVFNSTVDVKKQGHNQTFKNLVAAGGAHKFQRGLNLRVYLY